MSTNAYKIATYGSASASPFEQKIPIEYHGTLFDDLDTIEPMARLVGRLGVSRGHTFMWGGGGAGAMSFVPKGVIEARGFVHSVQPAFLSQIEPPMRGTQYNVQTTGMQDRKGVFAQRANAALIWTGGAGTVDEEENHRNDMLSGAYPIIPLQYCGPKKYFKYRWSDLFYGVMEGRYPSVVKSWVMHESNPHKMLKNIERFIEHLPYGTSTYYHGEDASGAPIYQPDPVCKAYGQAEHFQVGMAMAESVLGAETDKNIVFIAGHEPAALEYLARKNPQKLQNILEGIYKLADHMAGLDARIIGRGFNSGIEGIFNDRMIEKGARNQIAFPSLPAFVQGKVNPDLKTSVVRNRHVADDILIKHGKIFVVGPLGGLESSEAFYEALNELAVMIKRWQCREPGLTDLDFPRIIVNDWDGWFKGHCHQVNMMKAINTLIPEVMPLVKICTNFSQTKQEIRAALAFYAAKTPTYTAQSMAVQKEDGAPTTPSNEPDLLQLPMTKEGLSKMAVIRAQYNDRCLSGRV